MERVKFNHSIRMKLMASYLLLTTVLVVFFVGFSSIVISRYYQENIRLILSNQMENIHNYYKNYVGSIDGNTDTEKILENYASLAYRLQLIDKNSNIVKDSSTNFADSKIDWRALTQSDTPKNGFYTSVDKATKQDILLYVSSILNNQKQEGYFVLTTSLEKVNRSIRLIVGFLSLIGVLVIISAVLISKKLSLNITAPILDVIGVAKRIASGDLTSKAKQYNKDETGQLAESINHMSQELQKLDQLKNEFISSVTHELRTPLTSINGWAIILQDTPKEKEQELQRGLHIIAEESERLKNMVEDLLDFSRLNAGKLQLKLGNHDIIQIVKDVCESLHPRILASEMKLSMTLENEELRIPIDSERIKQVLLNILDNSIKYSSPGGRIEIQVGQLKKRMEHKESHSIHTLENQEEAWQELVQIKISDTGQGISAEELPQIKQRFYRGESSQNRKGVGIGLSICDQIISMHGGNLEIQSKHKEGTKVEILLKVS